MVKTRGVFTEYVRTLLAADARGEREISICQGSALRIREEGRWALRPSCLAEELTAVVFLY